MFRAKPVNWGAILSNTNQAIQLARTVFPPEPPPPPELPPPDPMQGFAAGAELAQYAMRPAAFYLGALHEDHGAGPVPAGVADDRHIFIIAGSRAGKGVSLGIPNALTWGGPLFMIDPKGEAASICAMRRGTAEAARGTGTGVRSFIGQTVVALDPLGQVRGPARSCRTTYNPLVDIDMSRGGGVRAIYATAAAVIQPEEGSGAHFSETAETILAGVIEAVKLTEAPDRQTLPHCRAVMLAGFDQLHGYLARVQTQAGLAREAATVMDEVGGDEWGSHRSTLSRNLKWLSEPDMQAHLAPSGFSLTQAMQEGASVFVCLPPDEIGRFKSWLRLIVRIALDAKMALGTNQKGSQTLCLLDEFPMLGRFKAIEESAGYMAGYGLKLVPIIQNIGQVQALYAKNWETFLGNAGAIVAFGLNDKDSEQYISDRLGRIMVEELSLSGSGGAGGASSGYGISRHERPVRFANEIHDQGARETMRAFVIPASGRSFTVHRHPYHATFPAGTFDPPDAITVWERAHWQA